jgi:hypothetical protein
VVDNNQVRLKGGRAFQCSGERFFPEAEHLISHLPVAGTGIGHLIAHPRHWKGQFFCFKKDRYKMKVRRHILTAFPVSGGYARYKALIMPPLSCYPDQIHKEDPASGMSRFLCDHM